VAVRIGGVERTRYLSTEAYKTEPADTPANQHYTARIIGGADFTRRLDLNGEGSSISFGDLQIDNEDGALDGWLNDIWAGRAVNIYLGQPDWPKSSFEKVFSGTVDDIQPTARSRMSLVLSDIFGPLASSISIATVGGTDDNANDLLPIALGECFNVSPVLVDSATQKYAVHLSSAIEGVIEVRDNALAVAETPTLSIGSFVLTAARYGTITADVQGEKRGGAWRNDVGGLVEWVATETGDGQFITSGQVDAGRMTAFRAACPQPVGMYIRGQMNRSDVMHQLAAAVGATVTTTYDGKLILVRVGFDTPAGAIGTKDILDESFAPVSRPAVQGAVRLDGMRNWTPQTSDIAGSVTADQIPIFQNEYVSFLSLDASVISNWKQSAYPASRQTLMVVDTDIADECDRLLALWGVPRCVFAFDGYPQLFQHEIGDTVTLTYPRFGLDAGVPAQIIGVQHNWVEQKVRLEVLV
jgi:hypothetical protein